MYHHYINLSYKFMLNDFTITVFKVQQDDINDNLLAKKIAEKLERAQGFPTQRLLQKHWIVVGLHSLSRLVGRIFLSLCTKKNVKKLLPSFQFHSFLSQKNRESSCLFVLHPLFFPTKEGRMRALSFNVKIIELILQSGCLSYHLTSWRKSTLIQTPTAQVIH